MNKLLILKELGAYLMRRKKWWLLPIVIVMLLMAGLLMLTQGSAVTPFIYSLF